MITKFKIFENLNSEDKKEFSKKVFDEFDSILSIISKALDSEYITDKETIKIKDKNSIENEIMFKNNSHSHNMNFITIMIMQDNRMTKNIMLNVPDRYEPNRNNEVTEYFRLLLENFAKKYKLINITKSRLTYYIRYPKIQYLIDFIEKYKKSEKFKKDIKRFELLTTADKYNL
jgi:hypothetical protein